MTYQVSRNGQLYGPYTLEDIQRYISTGNVLLTDLAKSPEMPDWMPVSQILTNSGASIPAPVVPAYAPPASYPFSPIPFPDPPNLHWALVILFGFLTCGIFTVVYDIIQTLWLKKVMPTSKALLYYLIFLGLEVLNFGYSIGRARLLLHGYPGSIAAGSISTSIFSSLLSIAIIVLFFVYRFTMRADLERHFNGPEPVGLRLSGVMTFFFGGWYFQYHFNRINEIKQSMRSRGLAV